MSSLRIDFESRSTVDLSKAGVYVYAQHPTTDLWCMAWAFDDEEPDVWVPNVGSDDMPPLCRYCEHTGGATCHGCGAPMHALDPRVVAHIESGGEVRAWNAAFERIMWRYIMVERYGAPAVRDEQWHCTAAEAAAMSLPRALDDAARVLGVAQQKDDEGKRLMQRMARPRKIEDDGTIKWWDDAERRGRLFDYCEQDVRTECAVVHSLRRLTPREREVYLLDQRANDRGVQLDVPLIRAAQEIVDVGTARANAALAEFTGGEVTAVTNHARLAQWVRDAGVETVGVAKATVAALLEGELPAAVRSALQERSDAGRSSVAKLTSMLACACPDERVRGMLLYCAARTGRWGGRLIQPHNFPRGEIADVEAFIPAVLARDFDGIDLIAPPVVVVSSMLRAMLTAGPGNELIAGDFSAIECRVVNWLAGQDDVLDAFRAYDAGDKTKDPYKIMAVKMGRAARVEDITKQDRQAGKAAELGCGFGMGGAKFVKAAWDVYQVRVTEDEARAAVDIYRTSHPRVKALWSELERACVESVLTPGPVTLVGRDGCLKVTCRGGYLFIILPSGRPLCYARPRVDEDGETPWGTPARRLSFAGADPYTRQWGRIDTYGGHLTENVVQAIARDLMAESMLRVEAHGYPPILSVHDEVVSEVPEGFGDVREYERLLATAPEWAAGCPISAEGWRGARYRK